MRVACCNAAYVTALFFGCAVLVATEFAPVGSGVSLAGEGAFSEVQLASLMPSFAVSAVLLGPIVAARTQNLSASLLMVMALTPFAANALLFWFPSYWLVLTLRIVQGAALSVFVATAMTSVSRMGTNGWGVGILYLGVALGGFAAQPLLMLTSSTLNWNVAWALLGVLCIPFAVYIAAYPKPEVEHPSKIISEQDSSSSPPLLIVFAAYLGFTALFLVYGNFTSATVALQLSQSQIASTLLSFSIGGFFGALLAPRAYFKHPTTGLAAMLLIHSAGVVGVYFLQAELIFAFAWGAGHGAFFALSQLAFMRAMPARPRLAGTLNISVGNLGIATGTAAGAYVLNVLSAGDILPYMVAGLNAAALILIAVLQTKARLNYLQSRGWSVDIKTPRGGA